MAKRLISRFAPFGGVNLPIPERPVIRDLPFSIEDIDADSE